MHKNKIQKSVIFANPSKPQDYFLRNRKIAKIVKAYPEKFIGFARFDPKLGSESIDELKIAINHLKLKGVKLHPFVEKFSPTDVTIYPFYESILNLKVPILLHFEPQYKIDKVLDDFPEIIFILGHLNATSLNLLKTHNNVFVETSGTSIDLIHKTVKYNSSRILFGSDYPYLSPSEEIKKIYAAVKDPSILKKIFFKNLQSLLQL